MFVGPEAEEINDPLPDDRDCKCSTYLLPRAAARNEAGGATGNRDNDMVVQLLCRERTDNIGDWSTMASPKKSKRVFDVRDAE